MKRNLDGASIVLAGASGGLGLHIGRRLVKAGAELVLFGRDESRLAKLDLPGPRTIGEIADASDCERAVEAAVSAYGQLDGVINASGVVAFGSLEELRSEIVDELLATNLIGPLRLMQAALPEVERGGFLANVSAIVAENPMPGMAMYSATKAALTALDRALARELRSRRIDVIDLRPPHMETGLVDRAIAGAPPRLPEGLAPEAVADRIVSAIQNGEREVAADAF
jgi:cyclic-di-GMP-binding biofilm dispersal mediator protein